MTRLAVIRPRPGCDSTVAAARALGLDARAFPLFEVGPVAWDAPDPAMFDALWRWRAVAVLTQESIPPLNSTTAFL